MSQTGIVTNKCEVWQTADYELCLVIEDAPIVEGICTFVLFSQLM